MGDVIYLSKWKKGQARLGSFRPPILTPRLPHRRGGTQEARAGLDLTAELRRLLMEE